MDIRLYCCNGLDTATRILPFGYCCCCVVVTVWIFAILPFGYRAVATVWILLQSCRLDIFCAVVTVWILCCNGLDIYCSETYFYCTIDTFSCWQAPPSSSLSLMRNRAFKIGRRGNVSSANLRRYVQYFLLALVSCNTFSSPGSRCPLLLLFALSIHPTETNQDAPFGLPLSPTAIITPPL